LKSSLYLLNFLVPIFMLLYVLFALLHIRVKMCLFFQGKIKNPLTLSHVHPAFTNWTIILSEDRNTVTSISAIITPQNSPINYLVLYQENPPHPALEVHENLCYVGSEYIRIETTLLPVPTEYRTSRFGGEWERAPVDRLLFIDHLLESLTCFPFCPLPWVIIIIAIILPVLAGRIYRKRTVNRK
jgi:hypothetical protein